MTESYPLSVLERGPLGSPVAPTAAQLVALGHFGLELGRAKRAEAINAISAHLKVPTGGWHGQARLFEKGDIRLVGVLALLTKEAQARHVANNLEVAARIGSVSPLLTLVTAQREHASSITAASAKLVDSFWEGGLDHLWTSKDHLGLPKSVTDKWGFIRPYPNPDANPAPGKVAGDVHPALIPARDQVLIYAAQTNQSFQQFLGHLRTELVLTVR